jgi:hypothetical protein
MPVIPSVSGAEYCIDLRSYRGRGPAKINAAVSRDFRTTQAFSPLFDIPSAAVVGRILEPVNGTKLSAGIYNSLIANLSDETGLAVPWDTSRVVWTVDDVPLQDVRQICLLEALPPGPHSIELRYRQPDGTVSVLDKIQIFVQPPTELQKEYQILLQQFLAFKKQKLF